MNPLTSNSSLPRTLRSAAISMLCLFGAFVILPSQAEADCGDHLQPQSLWMRTDHSSTNHTSVASRLPNSRPLQKTCLSCRASTPVNAPVLPSLDSQRFVGILPVQLAEVSTGRKFSCFACHFGKSSGEYPPILRPPIA